MLHVVDPRQTRFVDPFALVFTAMAYKRIRNSWKEVFRHVILELMPVEVMAQRFHETLGRPTKELYSMAGLLLIMEFMDWTEEEALDAYMFRADIQYALNLEPAMQELSLATLQRYRKAFREDELAAKVMADVTLKLVEEMELDISRQRLDSTHLESDMATFGRTRLMGVALKRFLTQVKRHDCEAFFGLPEVLRSRYEPSANRLFADKQRNKEERTHLRIQVAEDLHWVIENFADHEIHSSRDTYKKLVKIFEQQCEVHEEAIVVKKRTGGDVIQNPSDPDASYDGNKGAGYQLQISETCSDENEQQLIVGAIVETAASSDQNAVEPMLEDLERSELLPQLMLADGGYNSDDNVQVAEKKGVDLQSPVAARPGKSDEAPSIARSLTVDDFAIDPETERVQRCPAGHVPVSSQHDPVTGTTTTYMPESACSGCEFGGECPIKRAVGQFRLDHTPKERRLEERRGEQATGSFQQTFAKRSGGESVNSGLKRKTGLARVRVRGMQAVTHAALMRVVGWNIFRAAATPAFMAKLAAKTAKAAIECASRLRTWLLWTLHTLLTPPLTVDAAFRCMHRRRQLGSRVFHKMWKAACFEL